MPFKACFNVRREMPNLKNRLGKFGVLCLASGGFTGYFPVASGTFGSMVGVAIIWLYRDLPLTAQLPILIGLLAIGIWVSDKAGHIYGVADSSRIVIDEIVGMMITMIGIPVTPYWLVWGFLIFRFLDVAKFPPADIFDVRFKNGWGVMFDDVFAGIYGNIWLHLMLRATL